RCGPFGGDRGGAVARPAGRALRIAGLGGSGLRQGRCHRREPGPWPRRSAGTAGRDARHGPGRRGCGAGAVTRDESGAGVVLAVAMMGLLVTLTVGVVCGVGVVAVRRTAQGAADLAALAAADALQ